MHAPGTATLCGSWLTLGSATVTSMLGRGSLLIAPALLRPGLWVVEEISLEAKEERPLPLLIGGWAPASEREVKYLCCSCGLSGCVARGNGEGALGRGGYVPLGTLAPACWPGTRGAGGAEGSGYSCSTCKPSYNSV